MGADWALASFDKTPYKFNLLQSIALTLGNVDSDLSGVLSRGAPTGVYGHQFELRGCGQDVTG